MLQPNDSWTKQGIAIVPTEPWEAGGIKNFCGEITPLDHGEYRLWYYAHPEDRSGTVLAVAEGKPGQSMRKWYLHCSAGDARRRGTEYSLSNLPDGWRPTQPVFIELPDHTYRLYFWAHGFGVVRYLCADSTDGRHFAVRNPHQAVLYHPHDRAVDAEAMPDGLTLGGNNKYMRLAIEPLAPHELVCNDATHIYVLPDGSFELYTVSLLRVARDDSRYIAEDNAAGVIRVIDRMVSTDGIHFGQRQRVLSPDLDDPPGLQFYYLSITHLLDRRLGLLGHYRADNQTLAIERVWSQDGIHWERHERQPWLNHGGVNDPDEYGALAPHRLIRERDKWICFYTGFNYAHNFRRSSGTPRASVLWATNEGFENVLLGTRFRSSAIFSGSQS